MKITTLLNCCQLLLVSMGKNMILMESEWDFLRNGGYGPFDGLMNMFNHFCEEILEIIITIIIIATVIAIVIIFLKHKAK